jgi:molecular chaperone HscB
MLDFTKNHFELFGFAPAFRVDLVSLEQAYRDLQSQVHPDKFAHLGDAERRLSLQWATQVNEAYQTLRQPVARARYLLKLHGVETHEETNTSMSPEFLMEQMEWREAIGEAREAKDVAAFEELAAKLRAEVHEREARLGRLLDEEKKFAEAAEAVRELKFMEKLREEINHALEALES